MVATISECRVDSEFRDAVPAHDWQEIADLEKSIEAFGYLSPVIAWRNSAGTLLVLDGHARLEIYFAAEAEHSNSAALNLAALPPQVVEIELPNRDAALLWIIDHQTARRNLTDLQRIALAAKREDVVRRMAKANHADSLPGIGQRGFRSVLAQAPTQTRAECAKLAGVGEHTYAAGKLIIDAVADGTLPQQTVDDINAGTKSIHGVAKSLKAKPASKPKSSGWQTLVRGFTAAVRRLIKRDPQRRVEVAAELRRLADEFEGVATVAA